MITINFVISKKLRWFRLVIILSEEKKEKERVTITHLRGGFFSFFVPWGTRRTLPIMTSLTAQKDFDSTLARNVTRGCGVTTWARCVTRSISKFFPKAGISRLIDSPRKTHLDLLVFHPASHTAAAVTPRKGFKTFHKPFDNLSNQKMNFFVFFRTPIAKSGEKENHRSR